MVIRKISIDNSVKYVPIAEKEIKQNTTKNKKDRPVSGEGKQKKFSKNNKKFVKDFTASGFGVLKNSMYMYKIL